MRNDEQARCSRARLHTHCRFRKLVYIRIQTHVVYSIETSPRRRGNTSFGITHRKGENSIPRGSWCWDISLVLPGMLSFLKGVVMPTQGGLGPFISVLGTLFLLFSISLSLFLSVRLATSLVVC